MAKGEVVVRVDESEGGQKGRVQAAIFIKAPAPQIWKVMNDCDAAPEFVPGLKSCKILQHDDHADIIEHRVKFNWLLPAQTYVFRAEYQKFSRIDFTKVGGELRELEGTWLLERTNDGQETMVIYSVHLDPGFFVPQWLVRHILKGDLPELLTARE
jgi:ribosome-associated toxin RatA of RatAB toxin-antitoxin module